MSLNINEIYDIAILNQEGGTIMKVLLVNGSPNQKGCKK